MMQMDNKKFYTLSLKKYGRTARGLQWNSKNSQQVRFRQLLKFLPERMEQYKVVDAGCGFADLYYYLLQSGQQPLEYIGLDSMDAMVAEAQKRTSCQILHCDILKDGLIESDFYLCSGAMNIMSGFQTHLFIRRCYEASRIGFIFNVLWGEKEDLVYNYMSIDDIEMIAEELGASCEIKTGYLHGDMSVAFYKVAC